MKITSVRTFVVDCFRTNWVFVKVGTDEGIEGIGEGTLEYKENALAGAVKDIEHGIVGKDPFDTEWIWHENYRDAYWRGGPVLMSALSAVDMALWDIKGKALGVPCWKLLGGKCRDAVPCYANCWFAGAKEPEEFADKATAAVERGLLGLRHGLARIDFGLGRLIDFAQLRVARRQFPEQGIVAADHRALERLVDVL
ncbi:MAG: mandelate racemase, partial [Kiritimatiellae bacterium]|nr:mandelate racemase [Kiritimatiellia bacterium]